MKINNKTAELYLSDKELTEDLKQDLCFRSMRGAGEIMGDGKGGWIIQLLTERRMIRIFKILKKHGLRIRKPGGGRKPIGKTPRVTLSLRVDPQTRELLESMDAKSLGQAVDKAVAYYHHLPF